MSQFYNIYYEKKKLKKRSSHGLAWSNQVDLQKKGGVRSQVNPFLLQVKSLGLDCVFFFRFGLGRRIPIHFSMSRGEFQ